MRRLLREENGLAMITALLAMMVVTSLAVAGFQLSSHNLDQSANDRRRTQAIHAAEAGIDKFLLYLTTAPTTGTACSLPIESLPTSPASSFTVTATFYSDTAGTTALSCPTPSIAQSVLIHSVGTSAGVHRTMEANYILSSIQGGSPPFHGAVWSDGGTTFGGQATITGHPYGADLYSNGDVSLNGGGSDYGTVQTQGNLTLKGGTDIKQNAISKLTLDMTGGATVRGYAQSSTAALLSGGSSIIYGNAYYCTGSAPGGTVNGSSIQQCNSSLPAVQSWSTESQAFIYTPSNWTGYTINTFNDPGACTAAQTFINALPSGNQVVRVNSTCALSWGSQSVITLKGNLAIITNGDISLNSQAHFTAANPYSLYLWADELTSRPCNTGGISFNAQTYVDTMLTVQFYTPCNVSFGAQAGAFQGQVVAGNVSFSAGSNITAVDVNIPGPNPNGFNEQMAYRREVIG